MQSHWNDSGWHHNQWTGPNGGDINHVGFWGPNGYWGHTGVWGPNGGHFGHTTGIGPNGAYGRSSYLGPAGHWSRNWGGWYNGYGPAWGNGRWNYLWNQYPVAMAFGATMWGINAVDYAFGVTDYSNPYCDGPVYVDNQPVTTYTEPVVGDPSYETAANEDADAATDPLSQLFDQARTAFQGGQYDEALKLIDQALAQAPRDAAINEFRSLCLFALGKYRESAATIHAVLAAGPGWDWTTMSSLYPSTSAYTEQLRKLEAAATADPTAADLRFLLAYHYITCDHQDDAVMMLKAVTELQPKDKLAADLLQMYSSAPADAPPASAEPPKVDAPAYPLAKLQGDWVAKQADGEFELSLKADDSFSWKFVRGGQPQAVTGAYVVRGNNLVMQPDTGGTMLSTISLTDDNTLVFSPIDNSLKLTFKK